MLVSWNILVINIKGYLSDAHEEVTLQKQNIVTWHQSCCEHTIALHGENENVQWGLGDYNQDVNNAGDAAKHSHTAFFLILNYSHFQRRTLVNLVSDDSNDDDEGDDVSDVSWLTDTPLLYFFCLVCLSFLTFMQLSS